MEAAIISNPADLTGLNSDTRAIVFSFQPSQLDLIKAAKKCRGLQKVLISKGYEPHIAEKSKRMLEVMGIELIFKTLGIQGKKIRTTEV